MDSLTTQFQCQLSVILWHKSIGQCDTTHMCRWSVCSKSSRYLWAKKCTMRRNQFLHYYFWLLFSCVANKF